MLRTKHRFVSVDLLEQVHPSEMKKNISALGLSEEPSTNTKRLLICAELFGIFHQLSAPIDHPTITGCFKPR